ncbi:MAG: cyclase family protein [Planctomycetes bacterium]|nr:cyclase family protein [Planctomycetota bacterium]
MTTEIFDITPLVSTELAVWPGDTPMTREVLLDMKDGANITLSTLRATVHLGAHADAPSHYGTTAPSIESRSLDPYLGECQVVTVAIDRHTRIEPHHVEVEITAPRVLLRTGTFPDPRHFTEDFAALSPELVRVLHAQGVKLIGIDTPSVDLFDSKDLPAHLAFLQCDIAILEGIVLDDVDDGIYELIALPLKLDRFDASPVRAILRR